MLLFLLLSVHHRLQILLELPCDQGGGWNVPGVSQRLSSALSFLLSLSACTIVGFSRQVAMLSSFPHSRSLCYSRSVFSLFSVLVQLHSYLGFISLSSGSWVSIAFLPLFPIGAKLLSCISDWFFCGRVFPVPHPMVRIL